MEILSIKIYQHNQYTLSKKIVSLQFTADIPKQIKSLNQEIQKLTRLKDLFRVKMRNIGATNKKVTYIKK